MPGTTLGISDKLGTKHLKSPVLVRLSFQQGEINNEGSKINSQLIKGHGTLEGDKCRGVDRVKGPRSQRGGSSLQY